MTVISKGYILPSRPNFRDLGGISVRNGRTIRHGLVFRSGDLFSLKPEDLPGLERAGLRTIIDFRSGPEISRRPDDLLPTVTHRIHLPINEATHDFDPKTINESQPEDFLHVLADDYRRIVRRQTAVFRKFFEIIQDPGHLPVVYHCAAGKDRTGLATWFLLSALDVPEEVIRADYLATNVFAKDLADKIIAKTNEKGIRGEVIRPFLEVRNEYIDAALDEIETSYGGMDLFLANHVGADKEILRKIFLS